ncbi:hypothetical protein [Loktanella sp. S4079]|nr:hypothetical protein [Loktanella sp. S4079]
MAFFLFLMGLNENATILPDAQRHGDVAFIYLLAVGYLSRRVLGAGWIVG